MRVLHFADPHLGHIRHDRITPGGINQREADLARTFSRLIDAAIAIGPDLIVCGGDVFDKANPTVTAVQHAFAQFKRLRAALPGTEVVISAGNHDLSKVAGKGCALDLLSHLGIHVATYATKVFTFGDLTVAAVPDGCAIPAFKARGKHAVLVMHGEAPHLIPHATGKEFDPDDLAGWCYVALGHYHVHRQIEADAPTWYSGSLDYCSSDVWSELVEEQRRGVPGKGFVVHDLETGEHEFVPLPASRVLIDRVVSAAGLTPDEVTAALRDVVEASSIDDAVARIVVKDCTNEVKRALDWKLLRQYKRRALNCDFDFRKPEKIVAGVTVAVGGLGAKRKPLETVVVDYLTTCELAADVDRAEFIALGQHYVTEVSEHGGYRGTATVETEAAAHASADVAAD